MSTASATPEDVKRLAALARISISESELPAFAGEFESVLTYVSSLDELTLSIEATPAYPAVRNVLREDGVPTPAGTYTEKLVEQFPDRDGNYLSVKQIISHD